MNMPTISLAGRFNLIQFICSTPASVEVPGPTSTTGAGGELYGVQPWQVLIILKFKTKFC